MRYSAHVPIWQMSARTEGAGTSAHNTPDTVCQERGSRNFCSKHSWPCLPGQRKKELLHTKLMNLTARTEGAGTSAHNTHGTVCQDRGNMNVCPQHSWHFPPGQRDKELLQTKLMNMSARVEGAGTSAHIPHGTVYQDRGSRNFCPQYLGRG